MGWLPGRHEPGVNGLQMQAELPAASLWEPEGPSGGGSSAHFLARRPVLTAPGAVCGCWARALTVTLAV